jgi:hypothetical protein
MTKKIHVHLIDDLDATEASETLRFEVDGRTYEIDLNSQNAQKFRAEIAPYIEHARRVVPRGRPRGRAGTGSGGPRGRARPASRSHVRADAESRRSVSAYAGGPPPSAGFGSDGLAGSPPGPDAGDGERAPS